MEQVKVCMLDPLLRDWCPCLLAIPFKNDGVLMHWPTTPDCKRLKCAFLWLAATYHHHTEKAPFSMLKWRIELRKKVKSSSDKLDNQGPLLVDCQNLLHKHRRDPMLVSVGVATISMRKSNYCVINRQSHRQNGFGDNLQKKQHHVWISFQYLFPVIMK